MPYIEKKKRLKFTIINYLHVPDNPGELNYLFCKLAIGYVKKHGQRYQVFNDIIGALEGAKLEIHKRLIAGYEDKKRKKEGDVFKD